ncbi:MAG: hypothetical protein US89_C0002G0102 [Candidatus Peregrinibacteria bacterium GW2011_GWF2_38_29]|nr:MAG: hypothetical protein US89_C0002G0102 [Candidatus Peregrinibacteria bacterium GW2011_GWF2_38_29]HBB02260.1 hypothetical protein [Candidatus Peregrinibacteria bacterium]
MEATQAVERLPTLRSIDQIVISRILRHDMMDAISELLSCAYIKSIGKIGPFTAEDSDFLDLFLQKNKPQLIEIRQKLHDGRMKARDAEQEMDALIQNAKKNQIRGNGAEFTKLQLFIDQKKAEITTKAGFLKKITKGEEISESEANSETTDILKTEFAKAYNDTAKILLASGKLSQQEGDGDLASLQRMLQGLRLSMDAESVQTLPEILAQTTRDLFGLLEAVKAEVDRAMTLLANVKNSPATIAAPAPAAGLKQEDVSPLDSAKEWTIENLRKNTVIWAFFTVLLENANEMLTCAEVETLMRQKHPSFTSKIPSIHYDAKMLYEQHPAPFTLESGLAPNPKGGGRAISTYGIFTTKKQKAVKVVTEEPRGSYERKHQQAIEWVEETFGKDKGNNYWLGMYLAENFNKEVNSEQIEEYFKKVGFKQITGTAAMISNFTLSKGFKSSPYTIERNRSGARNTEGKAIATYRLTLKDGTAATQDDNGDEKDDEGGSGDDGNGGNDDKRNDDGKNDEIKAAIRESLEWIKTNKLDKRGSSLEGLATFLASNYGTSIPSHNERMDELLANNRTLINRLIKRLEELDCPFKIIVGNMPNPSKKGGHPSNIYCWMAK